MRSGTMAWRALMLLGAGLSIAGCRTEDRCGPSSSLTCGLRCSEVRLPEGNPSGSGVGSVDRYFSAVVSTATQSNLLRRELGEARRRLALSLALGDTASPEEISTALSERLQLEANAPPPFVFGSPPCVTDLRTVARSLSACDGDVDPEDVELECSEVCLSSSPASQGGSSGATECSLEDAPLCPGWGTASGSLECELWAQFQGFLHADCHLTVPELDGVPPLKEFDSRLPEELEHAAWSRHLGRQIAELRVLNERAARLIDFGEGTLTAIPPVRSLLEHSLEREPDLRSAVGLSCALDELDDVPNVLERPLADLSEEREFSQALVEEWTRTEL